MLEPLAAPVLLGDAGGASQYSSGVFVLGSSRFRRFSDLAGATLAFNDPDSLSGFHCVRFHLHAHQFPPRFFGAALATGGHQRSLEALLRGDADVAAIDLNVLRRLRRDRAWRRRLAGLRQLDDVPTLGPYPGQPFVAPKALGPAALAELRRALVRAAPAELRRLGWAAIVPVAPGTYGEVRRLLRECARAKDLLCDPAALGRLAAGPLEPRRSKRPARASDGPSPPKKCLRC